MELHEIEESIGTIAMRKNLSRTSYSGEVSQSGVGSVLIFMFGDIHYKNFLNFFR